jgi:hypothetical protein
MSSVAHIVLFEPKPTISEGDRQEFLAALEEAVSGIAEIRRARIGRPFYFGLMPETNSGQSTYSYAAVLEFDDRAALEHYLAHSKHENLRRIFWALCQSTLIIDTELSDNWSKDQLNLA